MSVTFCISEVKPEPTCTWLEAEKGLVLAGHDKRVLYNMNRETCKAACEEEKLFYCISADLNVGAGICYLQAVDRRTIKLASNAAFEYFERDCSGEG